MYVRRRVRLLHLMADSWRQMLVTLAWTLIVIGLYAVWSIHALIVPVLPVTLVGIAVSLYLGFKSTNAYLISWVFLTMEQVSDSLDDPFEGGVHDIPITALTRSSEIELRQAVGDAALPPRMAPIDNVLY